VRTRRDWYWWAPICWGLALVVFDLASVAPVAQDRGRLLPVEADLGGEGQDVRGV
jgi:hypothetical protein